MEYIELKEQIKAKLAIPQEFDGQRNLLELGLSSLKIMRLVNQWRKQGIRVPYGALMENPTLDGWWALIQGSGQSKVRKKGKNIEKRQSVECHKPFPLTDVQYAYKIGREEGEELGGVGCHAYLEFSGENVSAEKLEQAWNSVQYHHPMLRARFLDNGTQEIMDKPYEECIAVKDLRNQKDYEKILEEIREKLSHRKLKVEEGQVVGITLSMLPDGKSRIHFDLDLLVADVQSLQIVLRDLAAAYMGKTLPEESKDWSFADYLETQRKEEQIEKEQAEAYWNNRLEDFPYGPDLPLSKEPTEVKNTRFTRRIINISKGEWDHLQQRAAEQQATPAMLLLSAYAMVLERWSKTKRFLINIPFFNRKTEYKGLEEVVADFTTLLLLEVDMRKKQTFEELLETIQKQVHRDMKYTAYSGVQVQRNLTKVHGEKQNIAPIVFACNLGNPLINSEFKKNLGEFSYMISQTPGVWLDFQVYEDDNGLMLTWDTVDELFPEGMITDMIKCLEKFLHILGKEKWNQYFEVLPEEQTTFIEAQKKIEPLSYSERLFDAFLENVKNNPDKIAIIDSGENIQLSYEELGKKALSVAAYFVSHKIKKQPIAISLTRGYRQAVAALGILLSGNLYVPVTLNQPKDRRQAIHEKTGIFYALTDESHYDSVEWPSATQIWKLEDLCAGKPLERLPEICPEDSAYIIMTSGTTGLPKGAEMRHVGAWNTILDVNERANISSEDLVLGVSAMDFDLSVYDLFGMLNCGGTLVMIPEERSRDAEFWMQQIVKHHITVWNSVPVLLDMLLIQAEAQNIILPLKTVMLSGDWIGLDLPGRVEKLTEDCRFISMGGATEASIWSNYLEVKMPLPKEWKSIPYGRPLAHQSYRIVDEKGMDVPFWAEGELWIGGVGVGTYRGDEELVQRKFVKDESGIWYRTGDKGRFWNDGTIEFLGREDFQVKIRGHRIELGEIEAALKKIEQVKNAVVEPSDGKTGDRYLMAFLETDNERREPLFHKETGGQEQSEKRWCTLTEIEPITCEEKQFYDALKYSEWCSCKVMLETLQLLGVFLDDREYSYEHIILIGKIADSQRRTVKHWLAALVSYGFISESNGNYILKSQKGTKEGIRLSKIDDYLNRLRPYLPAILQGREKPINVYYAENSELTPNDLLEQLLGTEETVNVFVSRIKALAGTYPNCIRILETGTRDLRITRMILNALKDVTVEYTYSDASLFFVNEAKSLAEEYPFVKFEVLDLEKDITDPEREGSFDCVIAVNALHRLDKKETAFRNVKRVLTPSGILLMMELTIQTCLQDITATVLENGSRPEMETSILTSEQWKKILQENGFDRIFVYPELNALNGRNLFIVMSDCNQYSVNTEYVNRTIKEKLPEYMIPKVYFALDKLPLNKNGKIDRKKLHMFETRQVHKQVIEEPMTETEQILCAIWEETFQIEGIGKQDNYYLLGGDSLIATRMLTKIKEKFQVPFTIRDLMGRKTIHEQATRVDELLKKDKKIQSQNLPQIVPDKLHENDPFPLTEVQQAYWIGRSGMYDLGQVSTHCYFELDGHAINIEKLQVTWNELIQYHGMMRVIIRPDGQQQILKEVPEYQISVEHLEGCASEIVEEKLQEIRNEMSHQVITTEQWPLFDVRATIMPDEKCRIHISFDNLIFDGWSMFHLLSEWAKKYRGESEKSEKLDISFRDYVLGLEKIKNSGAYERDKEYWIKRTDNFVAAPELPLAKKEDSITEQKFNRREAYLSSEEWESLKNAAKIYGITPAVLLITAYVETLRRWSVNSDFTLNLTQFSRESLHPHVNQLVGDFTTLTLLEVKNSKEKTFMERAKKVQMQLMEDLDHTFYSAVDLERELRKKSSNMKGSIMPIVFTSGLGIDQWNEGKWIGNLVYNVSQTPQVWLDHQVVERDGGLCLFWDSVDELFYHGMLDEMFQAYIELLHRLASQPDIYEQRRYSLIEVEISEARKKANKTIIEFPLETLDSMFLQAAKTRLYKEAVVTPRRRMTYGEVKAEALYITQYLREKGIKKGEIVAIIMEKGWEQIVAVYGILFAGAVYLPIDVHNPKERIQKILNDSRTTTVLAQKEVIGKNEWLKQWDCLVVEGKAAEVSVEPVKNLPDDLAYVIYTSGSTGMPKGVMITHAGAVNTILDVNRRYKISEDDHALAISNLHFDLSVYDIFGILGVGGTLIVPDAEKTKDPAHWIELMNQENITVWNSVPAFMEMLVEYEQYQRKLENKTLRIVMLSGDWVPTTLPKRIYGIFEDVKIVAMGGATEASIWSNAFDVPEVVPQEWKSIPYGKPLANQKYYVLDDELQDCPDWVPGMLYIQGTGVAKGYLNDQEKTAEKFIYHSGKKEWLYCTGDMGRYWPDGNIEFLGRLDHQVKIAGYRIEIGEIETAINNYFGINDSKVVYVDKKYLIAFYCSDNEIEEIQLKKYLQKLIPSYMMPTRLKKVNGWPQNANGKVDMGNLQKQALELVKSVRQENKEGLKTQEEKVIGQIWTKLLDYENIDRNDNFFNYGGNSIKAIQMVNIINEKFGIQLTINELFENSTINKLAQLISIVVEETSESKAEEGFL